VALVVERFRMTDELQRAAQADLERGKAEEVMMGMRVTEEALLDVCVKREWQSIEMFRAFQLLEEEVFVADGDLAAAEEHATGLERRLRAVEKEKVELERRLQQSEVSLADAKRGRLTAVRRCKAAEAEHAATLAALQAKTWDPGKGKNGVIEQGGK
jgi:hypothetical protein